MDEGNGYSPVFFEASDDVAIFAYKVSLDGGTTFTGFNPYETDTEGLLVWTPSSSLAEGNYQCQFEIRASGKPSQFTVRSNIFTLSVGNVTPPTDTTPPNEVTNLSSSSINTTTLTLSWTASDSSDIKEYVVMKDGSELAVVTGTSYQVTGLAADTTYLFRVKARDQDDNTSNGVSINVSTLAIPDSTPPNDVTGLSSSNLTSSSVTVSWNSQLIYRFNKYYILSTLMELK